jgi:glycosyltransferase involved in cell wall biosynthesis
VQLRFLTSTPLNIRRGSGTYVGITVLERALSRVGHRVAIETPRRALPIYTLQRALFNRSLQLCPTADLTVGFDMDGYTVAGRGRPHIAALKGVIADELRFERGVTQATMRWQADREREHVHRADQVVTTSRYSAEQARDLYGLRDLPAVVPEPIDLAEWQRALAAQPLTPESGRFTVLYVGRLYRRKRVQLLLEAAAQLRARIPSLRVRIVGRGPHASVLDATWRKLRLEGTVEWLGDVTRTQLAAEYKSADAFCLPSVQEGFGIVLLEAMAAGKPIVAARAASIPEVVGDAVLVDPESAEALAAGIEELYRSPERRVRLAAAGQIRVKDFEAGRVAGLFLDAAAGRELAASAL